MIFLFTLILTLTSPMSTDPSIGEIVTDPVLTGRYCDVTIIEYNNSDNNMCTLNCPGLGGCNCKSYGGSWNCSCWTISGVPGGSYSGLGSGPCV